MANFEKLRKNCPWYYRGTNHAHSKMCWAVQRSKKLDVTCDKEFGLDCTRKNCAVYYWLKMERQGIS